MKSILSMICIYVLCTVSVTPLEIVEKSHPEPRESAVTSQSKKFTYYLKCIHDQCSMIESKPAHVDVEHEVSAAENSSEEEMSKRSSNGFYLNTMMKRFFGVNENNESTVKMFKPEEVKCWTDDCKVQMAKMSKKKINF